MKKLLTSITIFGSIILAALTFAGVASATLRVVQTPTLYLYSGESASAVTMRITPYPKDLDGTKLTITDLGDTPTVTVDPKISGYEEIESFTGITDNGDNTATLTGLSRNLTSKYPYTTAGTGKTHGAGAVVVFGNNPQIYGRLASKENNETITGTWTFATFPITPANSTSSETVAGNVEISTAAEAAASTQNGTVSRLVLPASLATSTYNAATAGSRVIITKTTGLIDLSFLGTTTVALPATTTVAGSLTLSGNTSVSNIASSTIENFVSTTTTASGYTWTKPNNLKYVVAEVIGGGGGGGGVNVNQNTGGGGGGGGAYCKAVIPAAAFSASTAIVVGGAGQGSGNGSSAGTTGGTSSFGSFCQSTGGVGGGGATGSAGGSGGGGGTATIGALLVNGRSGATGITGLSGRGGVSAFGFGDNGIAQVSDSSGDTAFGFGGGGGGAYGDSSSASVGGGNGTAGFVLLTEYFY